MNALPSSSVRRAFDSLPFRLLGAAWILLYRGCLLGLFLLMSLAEPFLAAILGGLALACFFVTVLFGFILHAHFGERWFMLGVSVALLGAYVGFRFLMQGVLRLLGEPP